MFNAKYKKGIADAAKAYEAFGEKQEAALNHILEEVRQGKKTLETAIAELNGNLNGLYDHLKSKEKASLYTVYTPFDIKELGDQERLFLLGALLRLTVDKSPNENQQNYIRAVQKYLEVKEPPFGVDPMAIENIENIPSQKAILQTVLEYLRLQDGDGYDETELQQEFLDAFSVSNRVKNEIINHVELLYGATGAQGLAEKYGYVPEEEPGEIAEDNLQGDTNHDSSVAEDIADDVADKIFRHLQELEGSYFPGSIDKFLEIDDYFLILKSKWISSNDDLDTSDDYCCQDFILYSISKKTGDRQLIFETYGGSEELSEKEIRRLIKLEKNGAAPNRLSDSFWESLDCCLRQNGVIDGNTVFISDNEKVYIIDVSAKNVQEVGPSIANYSLVAAKGPYLLFNSDSGDNNGAILLDRQTGKKHLLSTSRRLADYDRRNNEILVNWVCVGESVYVGFNGESYSDKKGGIAVISFSDKQCKPMVSFDENELYIISIIPYDNILYVLARVGYLGERYNVYAVQYDNLSGYTTIIKNLKIDSDHIEAYSNGWMFIKNGGEYPLKAFDFVKGELITLGKECGYTSYVKLHVWSKSSPVYHPYGFCVIGDFVYYRKGEGKQKIMRVSISNPSQVQLMD